ncbi:hypothetical protein M8A51_19265 [Schlegelella sp. S2-27]|uniref:4Fe-4S ferredoxin-type domain-containing protein n=1 Tax=Caldimonas mangrovi TaxID=2944811 RepID=A0ABT0YSH9_9BURK|nr:hypothetical protein [Caldimonas mangrovi]MCM5681671.1 hypothetical protein [Caldimonas mangrovi]
MDRVIYLHPQAPSKPPEYAVCNGCGVCCASEPCPLGRVLSRRASGPCRALLWDEGRHRYVCGALARPEQQLPRGLRWAAPWLARAARRMIAAGVGCDSSVLAQPQH